MATTANLLADGFGRIREDVAGILDGASDELLLWRPDPQANTICWLVWHLTRVQDAQVADALGHPQAWAAEGWEGRFSLPLDPGATGYGMPPEDVGRVRAGSALLAGYHEAVAHHTIEWVSGLVDDDLDRIVDERWDPPVTLGVRLVSILLDDGQHVGQAGYVKGLAQRAGVR